jgi:hypothetical protein
MKRFHHLEKIISAERKDNLDVLMQMENALSWDDLDSDLRKTYVEEIPYRRLVVQHLAFLLDCCKHWQCRQRTPPDVDANDLTRDLRDGLDWPEEFLREDMKKSHPPEEEWLFLDFLLRCSRRWRLNYKRSRRRPGHFKGEIKGDVLGSVSDEVIDEFEN